MRLFVYGTLLRGEDNHGQVRGARFITEARTEACYRLVEMGGYPALLEAGDTAIAGEIYEVDDALLADLDAFEDVPELYERKPLRLVGHEAEGYVMRAERARGRPVIASGDYRRRAGR